MEQNQQSVESNIGLNECPLPVSTRSKAKVFLWKAAGVFCVALAILGAILPLLPTTVFLIMATGCFAKSSPRMQKKLLNNKTFGPLIHEWQQHRSIPRKAKRIALLTIVLSIAWSSYLLQNILLSLLVILLVMGPFIFLWRLPESK
ncbi:MAG: YbaN family protein [Litorilituus sp.]|jgi:hypothetical protein|nr:YbaN family protein [Litorilituus sp.]